MKKKFLFSISTFLLLIMFYALNSNVYAGNQKDIATSIYIQIEKQCYEYKGKEIKPNFKIYKSGTSTEANLKQGTDYTLTYKNNNQIGYGSIVLKGIGDYKGEIYSSFSICKYSIENAVFSDFVKYEYTGKQIKPALPKMTYTTSDGKKICFQH